MTTVNPWVVFAVSSAAVFLVSVDATIAVAAFPALRLSLAHGVEISSGQCSRAFA